MSTLALPASGVARALVSRLRAAARALGDREPPPSTGEGFTDAATLLALLVGDVKQSPSPDRIWLLSVAVTGALPTSDALMSYIRMFDLAPETEIMLGFLDAGLDPVSVPAAAHDISIVTDSVVVDVNHSARYDLHTGVQQMVRSTVPLWVRDHGVVPVAWTDSILALRELERDERRRVLRRERRGERRQRGEESRTIVVPWRTVVVLPEPVRSMADRLACLARFSGNSVVVIGHDCIPAVSADMLPAEDVNRFARYLTVVKHAKRVVAVSKSAAEEFAGFADAVEVQGLPRPVVTHCSEAHEPPTGVTLDGVEAIGGRDPRVPLVLSVGSLAPHKNHLALLYAAERLWREGRVFDLLLIAGSQWGTEAPREIRRLQAAGRPLHVRSEATDAQVTAAYREARFTVFASLHEGFGLPLVESLSFGVPVITSNYGSMRESGAAGGVLLIDPREDEELVDAMRTLLIDDSRLEELRAEIGRRPARTWEDFAAELWETSVVPELEPLRSGASSSATASTSAMDRR